MAGGQPGMQANPMAGGQPGMQANPMAGGVQPAPDFLNPQGNAAAPPKMYTVQGAQYTAEQLKGFGWTDQQIASLG